MKKFEILWELPKCDAETQKGQMLLEKCTSRLNGCRVVTNLQFVKNNNNKVTCDKCKTGSAYIWKSFGVYSEKVPDVLFFCTFTLRKYISVFNIYLILSINEKILLSIGNVWNIGVLDFFFSISSIIWSNFWSIKLNLIYEIKYESIRHVKFLNYDVLGSITHM